VKSLFKELRSMKSRYLIGSVILVSIFIFSCSGCEKKRPDVLSIIPEDTQNIVLVPDVGSLMSGINEFFKLFENGVAFDALKKEMEIASQKLGINLMDPKSIVNAGFDPRGPVAVISLPVSADGKTQNVNLLIMTYSDRSKAEGTLNRLAREREKTEIFKSKSYLDAKIITAIRQGPKGEKPVLMYAFYRGYIIYGIPDKAETAIKKIVDTKENKSILNSPVYSGLKGRVSEGKIYFFINSGKNIEAGRLLLNKDMAEVLNSIKENFNGLILSFNISNKGVSVASFTGLSSKSMDNLKRYVVPTDKSEMESLLQIVPEDMLLLIKLSLDYREIYNLMKSENPYQMMIINKRLFGPILKYMEVDVEREIIPLLKGGMVYAVAPGDIKGINSAIESGFKGEAFNKLFNVYYAMNLRDKGGSEEFLNRFVQSMKEKGQKVEEIDLKGIKVNSSRFGAAFDSYWLIHRDSFYAFYGDKKIENVLDFFDEKEKKRDIRLSQGIREIVTNPSSQVLFLNLQPLKRVIDGIDETKIGSISDTGVYKFAFVLTKEILNRLNGAMIYLFPEKDGVVFNIDVNVKGGK
jgi:hypothetical protein